MRSIFYPLKSTKDNNLQEAQQFNNNLESDLEKSRALER